MVAYLTMALCLFGEDAYEEVAAKVTGAVNQWRCWDAGWSVPTVGGITQARKRLGRAVLAEVFERVAAPVGTRETRGAWLRQWRLLGIDGFDLDLPDTPRQPRGARLCRVWANRSALPKARVVALVECGTHAFLAAEVASYATGEKTLAHRLYPRLRTHELLTADRNFYSWQAWGWPPPPGRRCYGGLRPSWTSTPDAKTTDGSYADTEAEFYDITIWGQAAPNAARH